MIQALKLFILYITVSNIMAVILIYKNDKYRSKPLPPPDTPADEFRKNENMFIWIMSGVWPVTIPAIIIILINDLKNIYKQRDREVNTSQPLLFYLLLNNRHNPKLYMSIYSTHNYYIISYPHRVCNSPYSFLFHIQTLCLRRHQ